MLKLPLNCVVFRRFFACQSLKYKEYRLFFLFIVCSFICRLSENKNPASKMPDFVVNFAQIYSMFFYTVAKHTKQMF